MTPINEASLNILRQKIAELKSQLNYIKEIHISVTKDTCLETEVAVCTVVPSRQLSTLETEEIFSSIVEIELGIDELFIAAFFEDVTE